MDCFVKVFRLSDNSHVEFKDDIFIFQNDNKKGKMHFTRSGAKRFCESYAELVREKDGFTVESDDVYITVEKKTHLYSFLCLSLKDVNTFEIYMGLQLNDESWHRFYPIQVSPDLDVSGLERFIDECI